MEKLHEYIQKKTDLSPEQAQQAADAVTEFMKHRVTHAIDEEVNKAIKNLGWVIKAEVHEALTGETPATLGEKMGDLAEDAKEKMEDFAEDAKNRLSELGKNAQSFFGSFGKKKEESKEGEKDESSEKEEKSDD